jgi:hypothetical protein
MSTVPDHQISRAPAATGAPLAPRVPAPHGLPAVLRKSGWAAWSLFLLGFAILEGVHHGPGAWLALAGGLVAPDLSFLAGGPEPGERLVHGQLPRRTIPYYNAVHWTTVPFAAAVLYTFAPFEAPVLFTFLLAWMLHISLDRVMGYTLRTEEGFVRG